MTGASPDFQAQAAKTSSANSTESTISPVPSTLTSPNKRNTIIGLAAGSALFLAIFILTLILLTRRRKRYGSKDSPASEDGSESGRNASPDGTYIPDKTVAELITDTPTPGNAGSGLDQNPLNQILALADKRKDEIFAEKARLAVFKQQRLKPRTRLTSSTIKSSMSNKEHYPEMATLASPAATHDSDDQDRISILVGFKYPVVEVQTVQARIEASSITLPKTTRLSLGPKETATRNYLSIVTREPSVNRDISMGRVEDDSASASSTIATTKDNSNPSDSSTIIQASELLGSTSENVSTESTDVTIYSDINSIPDNSYNAHPWWKIADDSGHVNPKIPPKNPARLTKTKDSA